MHSAYGRSAMLCQNTLHWLVSSLYPVPIISVTEHQLPTHEETGSPQTPPGRNMPGHAAAHLQGGLGAAAGAGLL